MEVDLHLAELRPPGSEELPALYRFLGSVFPREKWLFKAAAAGEDLLYTWTPTCMFLGDKILGNVARFDVDIWLEHASTSVAGIASVATHPDARGMGIAKRILQAVLEPIDREGLNSALYTKQPQMYSSSGFRSVDQRYRMVSAGRIRRGLRNLKVEHLTALDDSSLERVRSIYSRLFPNIDGKVIRTNRYWSFYRGYFNHAPYKRIVLFRRRNTDVGYLRIEQESDRLLVTEFCCQAGSDEIVGQMYGSIEQMALSLGVGTIAVALADRHFLWRWLGEYGVVPRTESGAVREAFMVRGQSGQRSLKMEKVTWPLSDKF